MKSKTLLMTALAVAILTLSSCEKDGGGSASTGSRTSSGNISLASFTTLYSYIGRTDIENIAQRFRNEGYTVQIRYPEVEEGDKHGAITAVKYNNTGNGSAYHYKIEFDLENTVSSCRFGLYKPKARDEIINILNDQIMFCRNWAQASFKASIWPEGANHIEYSTAEEFQAALVELYGPTVYIKSYAVYDNDLSFEILCTDDVSLWYEIEKQSSLSALKITFDGQEIAMGWFDDLFDGTYMEIEAAAAYNGKGQIADVTLPYADMSFTEEGIYDAFYSVNANRIYNNLCEWRYDDNGNQEFRNSCQHHTNLV